MSEKPIVERACGLFGGRILDVSESKPVIVLGFYPEKNNFGDALPRGCGGPEDQKNPHRVRWCPQCKAVFEWPAGQPVDPRACAVCQHRPGVPAAFAELAKLMGHLCGYKPLSGVSPQIIGVPWVEYLAEFESSGCITPEQFLSGEVEHLRSLWHFLATQIKAKRVA